MFATTLHTHHHAWALPVVHFAEIEHAALRTARNLKNVALFAAAPFIGLLYAMALPFVGLVMLATIAARALARTGALATMRKATLVAAAPVIGLAYAVALPFIGIALIGRTAYQAARIAAR